MSPGRPLLIGLAAWCGLALSSVVSPSALELWWGAGAAFALVLLVDGLSLRRPGPFEAERDVAGSLALGVRGPVGLRVRTQARRTSVVEVTDHYPPSMRASGLPRTVTIPPDSVVEIGYALSPEARGDHRFGPVELRVRSRLGFWRRRVRCGEARDVRVFPNFREVVKYSLLATEHRTSLLGIRARPRRGQGLDFHALREYREGDTLRQIDWRATARAHRTISREYQEERDQQIVFLLDCGRKMHARDDALAHFDHALDAVLLLAHVALRQGDAVGLQTFSGRPRWLAPAKGSAQLNAVLRSLYDLETTLQASDYVRAAQALAARVRKRALVVIVSNLRDEDQDELELAVSLLRNRHLVLVASMRERALDLALGASIRDAEEAVRVAATHQYRQARWVSVERLRRAGVLSLDAEPDALAIALVNGYLDVKSASLL